MGVGRRTGPGAAATRLGRARSWVPDVLVTVLLLIPGLAGTHPAGEDQTQWSREPDVSAYLLVIAAALPFVLRRRHPGAVLAVNAAAVCTYLAVGYPFGPIMLSVLAATYTVGSRLPLALAVRWTVPYYLVVLALAITRFVGEGQDDLWQAITAMSVGSFAVFAAPLAVGAALRTRRESEQHVRAALARRAVSEERLRMAQELHDSVGHGLAVIAMQAGVGMHVLDRNPDKAREALEAIRDTSTEALNGLRAELQVLRTPADPTAPRRPAAGLAEADVLLERIRAGGIDVDAHVDLGTAGPPPDVDVAAYRILQEALTNVLRHSGAARAWVRVHCDDENLDIEVVDDGTGARPTADSSNGSAGGGSGIVGMRARAESLGGTLEAGPRAEGGFAVHARMPVATMSVPGSPS